jgi:hypothetical protein
VTGKSLRDVETGGVSNDVLGSLMAAVFRGSVLFSIIAACAGPAIAQPVPSPNTAPGLLLGKPMIIYRATGGPDACGPGCGEWIAAEGAFDLGAARRLQTFVSRLRGSNLPIFFNSPGGLQGEAMKIGRFLRERKMTVGVWRTIPDGCAQVDEQACRDMKSTGQTVKAGLQFGVCNSACVFALIGGWVRQVPPGARVGVHSAKRIIVRSDGRIIEASKATSKSSAAEFQAGYLQYFREMKADQRLLDVVSATPHEQVHVLSRDEIADFGIDARRFSETPWLIASHSPNSIAVTKLIVEAKGPGHNQYRVSGFLLSCAGPLRVLMLHLRGLSSEEIGKPAKVLVSIGQRKLDLSQNGSGRKIDALDRGGSFASSHDYVPFESFDEAVANGGIDVAEFDPAAPTVKSRDKRLSTLGLSDAIQRLRGRCANKT